MGLVLGVLCLRQVQIGSECSTNINKVQAVGMTMMRIKHGKPDGVELVRVILAGFSTRAPASWCPGIRVVNVKLPELADRTADAFATSPPAAIDNLKSRESWEGDGERDAERAGRR